MGGADIRVIQGRCGPAAQNISVTLDSSLHGSAQDSLDTPYRKACRRTWAQLIEKVYLVSPLVCPKCRSKMNIISFIEDPAVVRKTLKHLGIWEIKARPPPKKSISPCTVEPIPEECLIWVDETMYNNVDQVYED